MPWSPTSRCEFGLDAGLPIYSGGLGVLAGDHLKSACDLGVPLVGVGLLYRRATSASPSPPTAGSRSATRTTTCRTCRCRRRRPRRRAVVVEVELGDETGARGRCWRVQVGRVPLFLLDTNIEENSPRARDDHRARSTAATASSASARRSSWASAACAPWPPLGIAPTVFHMNEGHSAFLALERMRALIGRGRPDLAEAPRAGASPRPSSPPTRRCRPATRSSTPSSSAATWSRLAVETGHDLGRVPRPWPRTRTRASRFGMTPLALRTSGFANGVGALHGDISREMWRGLWPELPTTRCRSPHHQRRPPAELALPRHARAARPLPRPGLRERPEDQTVWERVDTIPAGELWRVHELRRERLVLFARERLRPSSPARARAASPAAPPATPCAPTR